MLFSELHGILRGSASVTMPDLSYVVSNEDVEELICFYGEREVISISGNPHASDRFDEHDILCEGALDIRLGAL